jgi:hypothetical protein
MQNVKLKIKNAESAFDSAALSVSRFAFCILHF